MALGDIYRLIRTVEIDGQTCINVLHFADEAGGGEGREEALLNAWDPPAGTDPAVEDLYQGLQKGFTSYTQVSLSAQRIQPDEGEIVTRAFNRGKTPATDSGLPTFAQVRFILQSDRKDRSGRGGFFMSGIAEGATDGNAINGVLIPEIQNVIQAIENVFTADGLAFSGFVIGVFSRLLLEFFEATSISHATTLGTMVSRRVGHGV